MIQHKTIDVSKAIDRGNEKLRVLNLFFYAVKTIYYETQYALSFDKIAKSQVAFRNKKQYIRSK